MKRPDSSGADLARNRQLDLLRAVAIVTVVFYHLIQMSPLPLPTMNRLAKYGQHGVDLFFVLSGWLIGGLYWREHLRFGGVQLGRFWLRRWMRTIPPYLAALALAWAAAWLQRGERFDWGYLIFVQNYYHRIPFFLVSWSLCIEEHFYLFLPMLMSLFVRFRQSMKVLFPALLIAAPLCRWWLSLDGVSSEFGFEKTATHLRMEGLLLGFWLARLPLVCGERWSLARRLSPWILVAAVLAFTTLQVVPEIWNYRLELTVLALGLAALLVMLVGRVPGAIVASRAVSAVALASYSVYLTHPLMIHAARRLLEGFPILLGGLAYFPVALGLIAGAGTAFYFGIERTSIVLRDLWVPRRGRGVTRRAYQIR